MVEKLEKYASNLEDIVQNRTEELLAEKKKADGLLYRLLPKSVHINFSINSKENAKCAFNYPFFDWASY